MNQQKGYMCDWGYVYNIGYYDNKFTEKYNLERENINDKIHIYKNDIKRYTDEINKINDLLSETHDIVLINNLTNQKIVINDKITKFKKILSMNNLKKHRLKSIKFVDFYDSNITNKLKRELSKEYYMIFVDTNKIYKENKLKDKKIYCTICQNTVMILRSPGLYQCNDCLYYKSIITENVYIPQTSLSSPFKNNLYSRSKYFNTLINKLTLRKKPKDENIVNTVKEYIKNNFITDITLKQIKKILKYIKYKNAYIYDIYIYNKIKYNLPPINLSSENKEILIQKFNKIENIWKNIKHTYVCNNSSFFDYRYTLHKLLELDGKYDKYLNLIPIESSIENIQKNDMIWEEICMKLKYKFIETI